MDHNLVDKLKWCERELHGLKQAHETGLGLVNFYSEESQLLWVPTWENQYQFHIVVQFASDIDYSPMCQCYINIAQYYEPIDIKFDEVNKTVEIIYMAYINNVTLDTKIKTISAAPIVSVVVEPMS